MAPKDPTRAQLSSRLTYSQNTPSFLLKLQNRIAGRHESFGQDEDEPQYLDGDEDVHFDDPRYDAYRGRGDGGAGSGANEEGEYDGRPPMPRRPGRSGADENGEGGGLDEFGRERRPPIPRRPQGDRGSADEGGESEREFEDEKPLVVVLRDGKHLTEREAENVRRREKGLPPLPVDDDLPDADTKTDDRKPKTKADPTMGLSFSSGKPTIKSAKRKAAAVGSRASDDDDDLVAAAKKLKKHKTKGTEKEKNLKGKKKKTLLSFGDEA